MEAIENIAKQVRPSNINNRIFVKTKCLFCENAEDRVLYVARLRESSFTAYAFSARRDRKREHYRIVACQKCGLIRSNPIIDESEIEALYLQSCFIFGKEASYAARTYVSILKKMMKDYINGRISSLLEIGSSTGSFLEEALAMGIQDVAGFEPSKDCYAHAHEAVKPRIINSNYDPRALGGKTFDLVCSFHVFDHLPDPLATLTSIKHCLNIGGFILLVCHDVESWSVKLLGNYNPIFDVEHIYLFSRKTIHKLVESAGFRVLKVGRFANRYPLGYWMRMLPFANRAVRHLPPFLRDIPITLNGGNLYAFGHLLRRTHAD